jgi:hypothetical protein
MNAFTRAFRSSGKLGLSHLLAELTESDQVRVPFGDPCSSSGKKLAFPWTNTAASMASGLSAVER